MPIGISGFIEVAMFDDTLEDSDSWRYCVDVSVFPLWTDDVCAILFGVAKWKFDWQPVASARGIPTSVGMVGKQQLDEVLAYQGIDKAYGFTYITYEELKQIDWAAYPDADLSELQKPWGWYTLFKVMDALSERFLAQRLTVWFSW